MLVDLFLRRMSESDEKKNETQTVVQWADSVLQQWRLNYYLYSAHRSHHVLKCKTQIFNRISFDTFVDK